MSCMDYKPLITNAGFLSVLSTQVCASAFSAVISLVAAKKCINSYFHVNCKTLHLVRYIIYENPCDTIMSAAFCFAWRLPQVMCLTSFAMIQLGLVIERAIALWRREHYENSGSALGIFIAACCIAAGAGLATWSIIQMNFQAQLVYCAPTSETSDRAKIRSYILCGINLTALFCAGVLYFLNEAALKR
ncbi:unnamed protein product [Cylicocyclus nassatus]|uniref:Uncharacterized protein n=1 Tax=Cylicocyclus nassatus TaxID=53992 RepID=A0AA36H9W8_CYLNA|nr:unnamed protein product [Cylicocyclus nassatus]